MRNVDQKGFILECERDADQAQAGRARISQARCPGRRRNGSTWNTRMKSYLKQAIEYEDQIMLEVLWRFPALDPKWAANRIMEQHKEAQRRNIEVAALMGPQVMRAMRG